MTDPPRRAAPTGCMAFHGPRGPSTPTENDMTLTEVFVAIRDTRREMKELGVTRSSCFNGGHSPDSYRLNARMFQLETVRHELRELAARAAFNAPSK